MKRRALALLFPFLYGCADGGPMEPTTIRRDLAEPATAFGIVAGSTLAVVSGETGQPVAGARVVLAGREHVSDGAGLVPVSDLVPNGASVTIRAPGFLERQTVVRRGEQTTFELWPSRSPTRMDREYTRSLVYASASLEADSALEPMDRPRLDNPRVAILASEAIARDQLAMQTLHEAALEITRATGGAIVYKVGEDASGVSVTLEVDPDNEQIVEENLRAFARCWRTRLAIDRCEIIFRSVEIVRTDTTLHELGHTFGLNHSPDRREIMGVRRLHAPDHFSPREELVMKLMLKRLPGNLFPDNDRQAPSLRAADGSGEVVCRHP